MAHILYNGGSATLHFADNRIPAYLQAVTAQRFADGAGFFVTSKGYDKDANEATTSYWFHPSIPIQFVYDEGDEQVVLEDDKLHWYVFMARSEFGIMLNGTVEDHPYQFDTGASDE
ncbi:DUF7882 family protein [Rhodococcus pyridinivorans]|uniref:DUF7882 domain-containing protein n=1 Tax=Rhodococcus pyridinivorans TaxID=103816 RepID=A0A7M2XHB7_9NOCA|nr:hypothetical protein [Rhodococcus pyridinivorans]QOV97226.1 hypothetical protein INP59_14750 [Rhodococcus pyridinivorans]